MSLAVTPVHNPKLACCVLRSPPLEALSNPEEDDLPEEAFPASRGPSPSPFELAGVGAGGLPSPTGRAAW